MKKSLALVSCLLLIGMVASAWAQGSADKGKAIVESKKCALCHTEGSNLGKPLEKLAVNNTDAHLKESINDPKKVLGPQVKMPEFKFTDEQLNDVIAYLKSIAKP